jgi:hypothetical protein
MQFLRKKQPTPQTPPSSPVEYPTGICVKTEKGAYRIHTDGKRYKIPTKAILDSWHFPLVVDSTEAALAKYPVALVKLAFRDGSLLNNIADGRMYLVSGGILRHVTDPAVLERLGNPQPVVVSDAEINLMKQGAQFI